MGNMCDNEKKPNPAIQSSFNPEKAKPQINKNQQTCIQQNTFTKQEVKQTEVKLTESTVPQVDIQTSISSQPVKKKENTQALQLQDFIVLNELGKGAFGQVFKVKKRSDNKIYAMKKIPKKLIIEHKLEQNTVLEKNVLKSSKHPFIVQLKYAFQTPSSLYFVMECVTGGEFYKILQATQGLPENVVRFVSAEVVLALEHLNVNLGIIYRDLKPENILLTEDGHVKLTDFGLATIKKENEKTYTLAGTPEYLAPEMVSRIGHSSEVDLWTLGVLIYEMINGYPPFNHPDRNIQKIQEQILKNKPFYPDIMSSESKDLIQRLLRSDPKERLGANGYSDLKAHPFFNGIKWLELKSMTQRSPLTMYARQNAQKQERVKKLPEKPVQETPCQAGPAFEGISYNPEGTDESLREKKFD